MAPARQVCRVPEIKAGARGWGKNLGPWRSPLPPGRSGFLADALLPHRIAINPERVRTRGDPLKARIYIADPAAFRQIAGHILEFAGLLALRADLRWFRLRQGEAALGALPNGFVLGRVHGLGLLSG